MDKQPSPPTSLTLNSLPLSQTLKEATQNFIKTLPGYVEGFIYEQMDGESPYNFLTNAVWKDEAAFEAAKKAVLAEYAKRGYDPAVTRQKLGIEQTRSTYSRNPY